MGQKNLNVIIIDTAKREVRPAVIPNTLKAMQEIVGGLIAFATELENGDAVMVNDEGLFDQELDFFTFKGAHQPFAGNGYIVGCDEQGATIDPKTSIEEIRRDIGFLSRAELQKAGA